MSEEIEKQEHYVYIYLDPRKPGNFNYGNYHFDFEPFYVGKGKGKRAWDHLKENQQKRSKKYYVIRKILREGYQLKPLILKQSMTDNEAIEEEITLISLIGREDLEKGPLLNLTNGGDGHSGAIGGNPFKNKTEEEMILIRDKLSKASKGENNPMFGKNYRDLMTEEAIEAHDKKISEANKGKPKSEEFKKQVSERFTGRTFSKETLEKMSKAHTGENHHLFNKSYEEVFGVDRAKEIKEKQSAIHSGKKHSDKTKENISKSRTNNPNVIGSNNPAAKKVRCIELDEIFSYMLEAAEKVYGDKKYKFRILISIKEKRKQKNFTWEFVN